MHINRDLEMPRPFASVVFNRRDETEIVKDGRPKLPNEKVDFGIDSLAELLELLQIRTDPSVREQLGFYGCQFQKKRRELLTERVMHVACYSSPLIFLRGDDSL